MLNFSIKPASFNGIVALGNRIVNCNDKDVYIKTQFFRPFCIVYLDQLLSNSEEIKAIYSKYHDLNQYLKQVKFPYLWHDAITSESFPEEDIIELKRFEGDLDLLADEVPAWLEQTVISKRFIPNFSSNLKKEIIENLWEIINNAMQHSDTLHGISCCGQFYPQCGYFEIAFYDFGRGIPGCVKSFSKKYKKFSDHECIEWTLKKGNTTKPGEEGGGLGLYYLCEFLKLNGGCLQIISHNEIYQSEGDQVSDSAHIKNMFKGTLFNLRIIYDNKLYFIEGDKV